MRTWFLLLACVVISACHKQPTVKRPPPEPLPAPADPKSQIKQPPATSKPEDIRFDLLRDTTDVSKNLVGTWYQVAHMRDGSTTTLNVAWYFTDGTYRDEYWTLVHKDRIATHGTDQGLWQMRGDTITLHFDGKAAVVKETKPAPQTAQPPATAEDVAAPAPTPAPAVAAEPVATTEPRKSRDDEQRLLEAAIDWFTYEFRGSVGVVTKDQQEVMVSNGLSVRVDNDFKMPRSIPEYRLEGDVPGPPAGVEK